MVDEIEHLLGRDSSGDETPRGRVVVETLEAVGEPGRHGGAGALGKLRDLLEVLHRHNAWHDRDVNSSSADLVEIAKVDLVVEKELGDRARGPGIDFRLEILDVLIHRTLGMTLGIGRHRDLKITDPL